MNYVEGAPNSNTNRNLVGCWVVLASNKCDKIAQHDAISYLNPI